MCGITAIISSFFIYSKMNNRIKEQLLGFLNTPPLWKDHDLFDLLQFPFPDPPVTELLNSRVEIPGLETNFVLGKRMEIFFDHLLKNSEKYEVIGKNLQIFQGKLTLGELDFLIKNMENNTFHHIELVYKFYVYDSSYENELERWIGPNRRDSLLQKIEKLNQRQFPILFKPESKKLLSELNLKD